jgi:hypothetical protein
MIITDFYGRHAFDLLACPWFFSGSIQPLVCGGREIGLLLLRMKSWELSCRKHDVKRVSRFGGRGMSDFLCGAPRVPEG